MMTRLEKYTRNFFGQFLYLSLFWKINIKIYIIPGFLSSFGSLRLYLVYLQRSFILHLYVPVLKSSFLESLDKIHSCISRSIDITINSSLSEIFLNYLWRRVI